MIIRCDPAVAFDLAAQAAMHNHLLATAPEVGSDGRHQASAFTQPVTWSLPVDMLRVQAERAMISMLSARNWRPDKRFAATAFEFLAPRDAVWQ